MTKPHTWKIILAKTEPHVSYIELQVQNKNDQLTITQAEDIISFVRVSIRVNAKQTWQIKCDCKLTSKYFQVNDLRECVPGLMEFSNEFFRLNITCSLRFNLKSEHDDWQNDQANQITFKVNENEINIC